MSKLVRYDRVSTENQDLFSQIKEAYETSLSILRSGKKDIKRKHHTVQSNYMQNWMCESKQELFYINESGNISSCAPKRLAMEQNFTLHKKLLEKNMICLHER